MMSRFKLLAIPGSIKKNSYHTAILTSLTPVVSEFCELSIFNIDDIPLYSEDIDKEDALPSVAALRGAIAAADGIIFAAPEYNHGISGVLKNILDWASRPYGKSELTGKPVMSFSASPAFTGGVRSQQQLNETLLAIGSKVMGGGQIVIPAVHTKVQNGVFTDTNTLEFMSEHIRRLTDY